MANPARTPPNKCFKTASKKCQKVDLAIGGTAEGNQAPKPTRGMPPWFGAVIQVLPWRNGRVRRPSPAQAPGTAAAQPGRRCLDYGWAGAAGAQQFFEKAVRPKAPSRPRESGKSAWSELDSEQVGPQAAQLVCRPLLGLRLHVPDRSGHQGLNGRTHRGLIAQHHAAGCAPARAPGPPSTAHRHPVSRPRSSKLPLTGPPGPAQFPKWMPLERRSGSARGGHRRPQQSCRASGEGTWNP